MHRQRCRRLGREWAAVAHRSLDAPRYAARRHPRHPSKPPPADATSGHRQGSTPPALQIPARTATHWRTIGQSRPRALAKHPRVSCVPGAATNRRISGTGRGVVVATICGVLPNLRLSARLSHVASALSHFAHSSAQARWCSGPRKPSGSAAENSVAIVPLGQISRRRDGFEPAFAFHHNRPRIGLGCGNKRDPDTRLRFGGSPDPFGTRPRLAKAAPGQDQPTTPRACRRALVAARPKAPMVPIIGQILAVFGEPAFKIFILVQRLEQVADMAFRRRHGRLSAARAYRAAWLPPYRQAGGAGRRSVRRAWPRCL